jgi:ABC-type bacteriocin/lantibiotic exporter with double-glycine peptidase domain
MEIYVFVGSLLIFLAILTPILSIVIHKKIIKNNYYETVTILTTVLIIAILLIIGFNCLIKSELIF